MTPNEKKNEVKKPILKLPFTNKKSDIGEWAFDHKAGLCVTLIAYLVLSIAFVGGKILVGDKPHAQGFYIDIEDIEKLEEKRDELQQEVDTKQQFDWSSVKNKRSNENSLDERVKDDRGTNTSELNYKASQAQEEMRANREAYEKAIAEIENNQKRGNNTDQESGERRDIKQKGNVTVSYTFTNPLRQAQTLITPAYQCQGGGEVVVRVTINREGKVLDTEVIKGSDKCMREAAERAARLSKFNVEDSAPPKQKGLISYIFIPQ